MKVRIEHTKKDDCYYHVYFILAGGKLAYITTLFEDHLYDLLDDNEVFQNIKNMGLCKYAECEMTLKPAMMEEL